MATKLRMKTAQNDEGEKDYELDQLQAIHLDDIPKILTWLAFLGQNSFHPLFLVQNNAATFESSNEFHFSSQQQHGN